MLLEQEAFLEDITEEYKKYGGILHDPNNTHVDDIIPFYTSQMHYLLLKLLPQRTWLFDMWSGIATSFEELVSTYYERKDSYLLPVQFLLLLDNFLKACSSTDKLKIMRKYSLKEFDKSFQREPALRKYLSPNMIKIYEFLFDEFKGKNKDKVIEDKDVLIREYVGDFLLFFGTQFQNLIVRTSKLWEDKKLYSLLLPVIMILTQVPIKQPLH